MGYMPLPNKRRKTYDEYDIYGNYGNGWELATGCTDRKNARELLKEYRENQPEYPHKIVKTRVKKIDCQHNQMMWVGDKWLCATCGYMYSSFQKCPTCGAVNDIVNKCACDQNNLPTRPI